MTERAIAAAEDRNQEIEQEIQEADEKRPSGSNADEWHLFLTKYADNRAAFPNGLTFLAVQISEAIDQVRVRAEKAEACVKEMRKEVRDAYRDGLAEGFER